MALTYNTIASTTTTASTSTITFSSIPSTYTDLVVKIYIPTSSANGENLCMRFNGDTGANYNQVRGVSAYPSASGDYDNNATYTYGVLTNTVYATVATWDIFNYASNKFKTILHKGSTYNQRTDIFAATWESTVAINSITIFPTGSATMAAGTKISIHGILRA
jgi:hypothetical protein